MLWLGRNKIEELEKALKGSHEEATRLRALCEAQKGEIEALDKLVRKYKDRYETERAFVDSLDPTPTDTQERKNYVAQVTGIFHQFLKPKLEHIISLQKHELSRFDATEDQTRFFRSCVNVCYLLLDWGESLSAEHMGYLQEAKEMFEVSDAERRLKEVIKR